MTPIIPIIYPLYNIFAYNPGKKVESIIFYYLKLIPVDFYKE